MWVLSESRLGRFITFGALYLAQGIPWGFIAVGYVVFLTNHGLNNEQVGEAIALAYLPWSFKIFWGPIIDRFPSVKMGRRRPYILLAEFLMGATLLALLIPDPSTQLGLIGGILFLHNTFAAMQDVASDALAVDILPDDERGRANSIMWACKSAGVAVGGAGGTVFAKYLGYPALFVTMALLIWAVMFLVYRLRERAPSSDPAHHAPIRMDWGQLKRSFSFRAPLMGIVLAVLTPAGYALVSTPFTRMLKADLKLTEEAIGTLQGLLDPVAGVVGALLGGLLADRLGKRRTMGIAMLGIGIILATFSSLQPHWSRYEVLIGYVVALNLCVYAYNAASLGFYMQLSNPAIGATQFAIFMAGTNLCYSVTAKYGGRIADGFGYGSLFLIAAVVQVAAVALLPLCDPRQAEERFRSVG